MTPLLPHQTLMQLHRFVDRSLSPLLAPMSLGHATESYLTVSRAELDALVTAHGDPQAVLVGFGAAANANEHGVLIAEPSLTNAILGRIWRSDRRAGAPLTQVEGEILRQFLARAIGSWSGAWHEEGIALTPSLTLAGNLSMLRPQLTTETWHVARMVVRDTSADGEPLGVFLFCYPDSLLPQLGTEAGATRWRARLARGLDAASQRELNARLTGPMRDVTFTAPIRIMQHMTLGMINSLERGDVVAFDAHPERGISFDVLGREMSGMLARTDDRLALAMTSPDMSAADAPASGAAQHEEQYAGMASSSGMNGPMPATGYDHDLPPEPSWDNELAS